jgi:hypothetical protein
MTEYNAKAAIMVAASPVICHDTFAKPERLTRFWFPRVSGPIRPGADLEWYMGEEKDAQCIPVTIDDAFPGDSIDMRWGSGETETHVSWTFTEKGPHTEIKVVESGFKGSEHDKMTRALTQTAVLNQVLVAAKAQIEHDVDINVIEDRAAG